jgi:hypothetical protein
MATVSPNPSDREIIDGVCGGVITPEKAVELLRGDGDSKLYLLQKLAGGVLPVAHGVRLEARLTVGSGPQAGAIPGRQPCEP